MIILDTHTWLWWTDESKQLSKKAQNAIKAAPSLGVCAISCWEVAMLVSKGRLSFDMDITQWIGLALKRPKVQLLPLLPEISILSTRLPGEFHGDPADRMIAASCLFHQAPLVTKDQKLQDCHYLRSIW